MNGSKMLSQTLKLFFNTSFEGFVTFKQPILHIHQEALLRLHMVCNIRCD